MSMINVKSLVLLGSCYYYKPVHEHVGTILQFTCMVCLNIFNIANAGSLINQMTPLKN